MRQMRTIGCVHNEANGNCLCGRSRVHCAGWHCGAACTNLSAVIGAYNDFKCHTSCACTIALGPRVAVLPLCDAYFTRLAALGAYTDCKCHTSCACTNALGPRLAGLPLCYTYFARLAVHGAYTDCKCHTTRTIKHEPHYLRLASARRSGRPFGRTACALPQLPYAASKPLRHIKKARSP